MMCLQHDVIRCFVVNMNRQEVNTIGDNADPPGLQYISGIIAGIGTEDDERLHRAVLMCDAIAHMAFTDTSRDKMLLFAKIESLASTQTENSVDIKCACTSDLGVSVLIKKNHNMIWRLYAQKDGRVLLIHEIMKGMMQIRLNPIPV